VPRRLEGRTAVITGASRGIGLGIAAQLVADGARVVITGRKREALDSAVASLGGPDVAAGVAGHAADVVHQAATVESALEHFGSVDCLVNNAGVNPVYGPLMNLDIEAARKVVEVNALASLSWTQLVYRAWMSAHGGSIVNVSSISGVRAASPNIAMYAASKAMLCHLSQELALELGPGIRVNAVAPALVKTDFARALYDDREDEIAATYPLMRLGRTEDIGSSVAFLLSEEASWITGQVLVVDGGLLLQGGQG
jgi:NAD(P)-dependent dehydrogenase (short-subunit alcohol dehydrogenase family)